MDTECFMVNPKIIDVRFYMSDSGALPVRDWLQKLPSEDRKNIGKDIRTVEFGWPLGMPIVKKIGADLWEVRSNLLNNRTARIIFTVEEHLMILLHGFIKKSDKITKNDLRIAKQRMSKVKG